MRAEAGARPARRGRPARLRRGRARLVRRAARWAAWAVAAAFLLLLVVGFAYAGSAGTIAGGVTVAGVDLAGLTGAEAEDELEKRARELGGKVAAPNVQVFKSKKDFEAFHLKKPREA